MTRRELFGCLVAPLLIGKGHWDRNFWSGFRPYFLRRNVEVVEVYFYNDASPKLVVWPKGEFERQIIMKVFGVTPERLGLR
jgi:hypothetical protein